MKKLITYKGIDIWKETSKSDYPIIIKDLPTILSFIHSNSVKAFKNITDAKKAIDKYFKEDISTKKIFKMPQLNKVRDRKNNS